MVASVCVLSGCRACALALCVGEVWCLIIAISDSGSGSGHGPQVGVQSEVWRVVESPPQAPRRRRHSPEAGKNFKKIAILYLVTGMLSAQDSRPCQSKNLNQDSSIFSS